MITIGNDKLRKTQALQYFEDVSSNFKEVMSAYIQGAVYQYIKDNWEKDEIKFAARDLFGGVNWNWANTPLDELYKYHLSNGKTKSEAYETAAKDVGWLMKDVLKKDKNITVDNSEEGYYTRIYKVIDKKNI